MLAAIPSAGALSADYLIFPNGTAYRASIEIVDSSRYEFVDTGMLGEPVPLTVGEVQAVRELFSLPVQPDRTLVYQQCQGNDI